MRAVSSEKRPGLNSSFIYQTFYLDPYDGRQLFAIDRPLHISLRGAVNHGDYTYALRTNIDKRIRYEAISLLADSIREDIDVAFYLQLPASISSRVKDLVANLTQKRAEEEKVLAILKYLNNGSFRYTLKELPISDDPIDTFLFHARQGNCEYFASSFAIMLRMAGIPSRLVGGYRGGYYNDVGRYYLVLQRNAHLWVEAYLTDKGWVRFDPTPQTIGGLASLYGGSLSIRLRLLLDTINYYWYTTVINYDFERQLSLVHRLGHAIRRPTLEEGFIRGVINGMAASKYIVFAIIFICVAISITYTMIHKVGPVEKRIIVRFYKVMQMYGYQKRETEGLEEFVSRIKETEVREASYTFVKEFEGLYFKDKRPTPLDKRRLKRMIKAIKTSSHGSA
jgi:transglutaminase-like putative cysteine protease